MKKPNQQMGFTKIDRKNSQSGGTILGFVLGLGAGLGIAFGITFYLNKNTPQERPGVRAPNLPLTIKPSTAPAEGESSAPAAPLDLNKPLQGFTMAKYGTAQHKKYSKNSLRQALLLGFT